MASEIRLVGGGSGGLPEPSSRRSCFLRKSKTESSEDRCWDLGTRICPLSRHEAPSPRVVEAYATVPPYMWSTRQEHPHHNTKNWLFPLRSDRGILFVNFALSPSGTAGYPDSSFEVSHHHQEPVHHQDGGRRGVLKKGQAEG